MAKIPPNCRLISVVLDARAISRLEYLTKRWELPPVHVVRRLLREAYESENGPPLENIPVSVAYYGEGRGRKKPDDDTE